MKRTVLLVGAIVVFVLALAGVAHAATPIDMYYDYVSHRGFTQTYSEAELQACLTDAGVAEVTDLFKYTAFLNSVRNLLKKWPAAFSVEPAAAPSDQSAANTQGGTASTPAQSALPSGGEGQAVADEPAAASGPIVVASAGQTAPEQTSAATQEPAAPSAQAGSDAPVLVGATVGSGEAAPATRWHFALFGMVAVPGIGGGAVWLRRWRQKRES